MWGSTFQDHWSKGFDGFLELIQDLRAEGFEVEDADLSLKDNFVWPDLTELSSTQDPNFGKQSWGYLSAPFKNVWPSEFAFLIAHKSRKKDFVVSDAAKAVLWTRHPEAVLDYLLRKFSHEEWTGVSSDLPAHVRVETGVVIGPDCEIAEGCVLETGVRLGARVKIGARTRIGAYTRVGDDTTIGHDSVILAHNSIANQGFGMLDHPQFPHRRPRLHVGRVNIGNYVRTGAFVSIDRALFGVTRVGDGTCLDSHVHVAHNVEIGHSNILCGFVGVAGSTKIGDRCTFAGMVGVQDHVKIGNDVLVAGQSGVTSSLPDGVQVKGYPPRPLSEALKISSLQARLPEIYQRLKNIEKQLKETSNDIG